MTLDRRIAALEQRRIYRIASLADVAILTAWRQRGDPRTPNAEDVEWDPVFADIFDACTKRGDGLAMIRQFMRRLESQVAMPGFSRFERDE